MLGAPMKAIFPLVPIMRNQNFGIALFSYNGRLHWGFNADWLGFPDVHEFVEDLEASFDEYRRLATARAPGISAGRETNASH